MSAEYEDVTDENDYLGRESNPNDINSPRVYRLKDVDLDQINSFRVYGRDKVDNNLNIKSASVQVTSLPQYVDPFTGMSVSQEFTILSPFYSDEWNNRCANAYLFDDVINSAIERLAHFTLGPTDEITSILYPESIRPLKSEMEAKDKIKQLKIVKSAIDKAGSVINNQLSDQEISQIEEYIHYTDKICKLGRFLKKNYRGAHVFARSASYIQYSDNSIDDLGIPAGNPIALVPLKPMHLGRVAIDRNTLNIKAVEYTDPKVNFAEYADVGIDIIDPKSGNQQKPKFLDANDLLYFVRNNNNMMKDNDDFYFGHSTLQSIMSLSEENRRLKQIIWPAINQGHWASSGIWFFPNWTNAMMSKFFSKLRPGAHTGVPQSNIRFQESQLKYDYNGLINLSNTIKTQILSAFGMPSFLMNFEAANTKATAETVVIGFSESTIQSERSWLSDILDEQWYSKLLRIKFPDDQYIHIKLKLMMEFENISFETFFEKAVAVVSMIEKKVITLTEGRNMLKLPPLLPADLEELGLSTNPNMVDPALQGVPNSANLVNRLMMENNLQQQNNSGSVISGSNIDTKFTELMKSFNNALSYAKSQVT